MRKALFNISIIFLSFHYSGDCQDLDYNFELGQVLEYEYMFDQLDSSRVYARRHNNNRVRFTVLEKKSGSYILECNILKTSRKITYKDESGLGSHYYSPYDSTASNIIEYADVRKPFQFNMTRKGEIKNIEGIEELFERTINELKQRDPGYKYNVSFDYLNFRLGQVYYKKFIHDFFPLLKDSNEVFDSHFHQIKINSHLRLSEGASTNKHYLLNMDIDLEGKGDNNKKHKISSGETGYLNWNKSLGTFDHIEYYGVDWAFFWQDIVNPYGIHPLYLQGRVKVKMINNSDTNPQKAIIIGEFIDFEKGNIEVFLPNNSLVRKPKEYKIDSKQKTIEIKFDMFNAVNVAKLVLYYYPKLNGEIRNNSTYFLEQCIIVRPGDTIELRIKNEKLLSPASNQEFQILSKSKEQEVYEDFSDLMLSTRQGPGAPLSEKSKEILYGYRERFRETWPDQTDPFHQWFLDESFYHILDIEVAYHYFKGRSKYGNLDFTELSDFLPYLGYPNGGEHESYKAFIEGLVRTEQQHILRRGQRVRSNRKYKVAELILSGWDLFYYQSQEITKKLNKFYSWEFNYFYNIYQNRYYNTEYAQDLREKFSRLEAIMPGKSAPNLKFTDINDNNFQIRSLRGKDIILYPWHDNRANGNNNLEWLTGDNMNMFDIQDMELVSVYTGDDFERARSIITELDLPGHHIANKEGRNTILNFYQGQSTIPVIFDKDQIIATYSEFSRLSLFPLSSWPANIASKPHTVNRLVLWYISTGIITLAVLLLIVFRSRSKKREAKQAQRRKMAELELGAVRSRMNPHFLFNALGSIQNLVNGNEIEKANLYLADFGDLVRSILTQSSKNQISLAEELETLRTYLDLEQLRYPFKYSIHIDEDVNPEKIEIPPLFIQPHVENAIIHGLSEMGDKGVLDIRFSVDGSKLLVIVEDNGEGLQSNDLESKGLGQGWKLTNQRVQLLNEQWGKNISVEMIKDDRKSGMRVKFVIPVEN